MNTTEAPFKADYAKTGRSKCKYCKKLISNHSLRLATRVQVSITKIIYYNIINNNYIIQHIVYI